MALTRPLMLTVRTIHAAAVEFERRGGALGMARVTRDGEGRGGWEQDQGVGMAMGRVPVGMVRVMDRARESKQGSL